MRSIETIVPAVSIVAVIAIAYVQLHKYRAGQLVAQAHNMRLETGMFITVSHSPDNCGTQTCQPIHGVVIGQPYFKDDDIFVPLMSGGVVTQVRIMTHQGGYNPHWSTSGHIITKH